MLNKKDLQLITFQNLHRDEIATANRYKQYWNSFSSRLENICKAKASEGKYNVELLLDEIPYHINNENVDAIFNYFAINLKELGFYTMLSFDPDLKNYKLYISWDKDDD